jgi:hypothetical protein
MRPEDKQTENTTYGVMATGVFSSVVIGVCVYGGTHSASLAAAAVMAGLKVDSLILQLRLIYGWVSRDWDHQ